MALYFAYGANMDVAAMAKRTPGGKPLGVARLMRHRFVITQHGYASVVRDPRGVVFGLLWDFPIGEICILDRFEDIHRGLYTKLEQPVISANGPRRALIYIGTGEPGGTPRPGYLETLLRAAAEIGLPEPYRKSLALHLRQNPSPLGSVHKSSGKPEREAWTWGD
ncbi:Gamma-glutamyl cyclotransferase-like [Rhabdaerophilaceae bacterium]